MKLDRAELLDVLRKIKPGVTKKDNITNQNSHFIFTGENVLSCNDLISISCPFKSEFIGGIPGIEFYEILNKIDDKEIDFRIEGNKLYLNTEKIELELLIISKIDDGFLITPPDGDWKELPEDFIQGVSFCSFSTSKDDMYQILTMINAFGKNAISTDKYRMTCYEFMTELTDNILIPVSIIKELTNFHVTKYLLSPSRVFFKTEDNIVFSYRQIEGKFPKILNILETKGEIITLPEDIIKGIDIVSIFAEEIIDLGKRITVTIENEQLVCSAFKEIGKIDFKIRSKSLQGKKFTFAINPDFFKIILLKSNTVIIDKSKITFIADKFKHVISLY